MKIRLKTRGKAKEHRTVIGRSSDDSGRKRGGKVEERWIKLIIRNKTFQHEKKSNRNRKEQKVICRLLWFTK